MAGRCSAERLALLIAVGLVLGTFPIVGCPTVLCLLAAMLLRLNIAALQVINQITSPLQFALWLPLARIGAHAALSHGNSAFYKVGILGLQAIIGWLVICVPTGALIYVGALYAIQATRSNAGSEAIERGSESTTFSPQMG